MRSPLLVVLAVLTGNSFPAFLASIARRPTSADLYGRSAIAFPFGGGADNRRRRPLPRRASRRYRPYKPFSRPSQNFRDVFDDIDRRTERRQPPIQLTFDRLPQPRPHYYAPRPGRQRYYKASSQYYRQPYREPAELTRYHHQQQQQPQPQQTHRPVNAHVPPLRVQPALRPQPHHYDSSPLGGLSSQAPRLTSYHGKPETWGKKYGYKSTGYGNWEKDSRGAAEKKFGYDNRGFGHETKPSDEEIAQDPDLQALMRGPPRTPLTQHLHEHVAQLPGEQKPHAPQAPRPPPTPPVVASPHRQPMAVQAAVNQQLPETRPQQQPLANNKTLRQTSQRDGSRSQYSPPVAAYGYRAANSALKQTGRKQPYG